MPCRPAYVQPLHDVLRYGRFGHAQHLELAWRYLRLAEEREAEELMCAAIRDVADGHGTPMKYHETLTRAWVRLVRLHEPTDGEDFEMFLGRSPGLLDRNLVGRHYSPEALGSGTARSCWLEPDRRPFLHVRGETGD